MSHEGATLRCLGKRPPRQECSGRAAQRICALEPPQRRNFQRSYKTDNGMCTQQEWKIRGALQGFPHSSLSMGQTCMPCICWSLSVCGFLGVFMSTCWRDIPTGIHWCCLALPEFLYIHCKTYNGLGTLQDIFICEHADRIKSRHFKE